MRYCDRAQMKNPKKKNNKAQIDLKHLISSHIMQFVNFEAIIFFLFIYTEPK